MTINLKYAHYNNIYKRARVLALALGVSDEKEIFDLVNYQVSKSQLNGWRVGPNNKNFRIIDEDTVLVFLQGLIEWERIKDKAN